MAAYAMCSRAVMYGMPLTPPLTPMKVDTMPRESENEAGKKSLTANDKLTTAGHGNGHLTKKPTKSRGGKWKRLDLGADIEAEKETSTGQSMLGTAPTSKVSCPNTTSQPDPPVPHPAVAPTPAPATNQIPTAKPSKATSNHHRFSQQTPEQKKLKSKKRKYKTRQKKMDAAATVMLTTAPEAKAARPEYIPPHVRRRNGNIGATTNGAKPTPTPAAPRPAASPSPSSSPAPVQPPVEKSPAEKSPAEKSPAENPPGETSAEKAPPIWGVWTEPQPEPIASATEPSHPRGGIISKNFRGKARWVWPQRAPRQAWLKSKDIPKGPPTDDSEGGITWKSNSNGDPCYDVKKLMEWNGGWAPGPVEWEGRKCFKDRHFGDHIEAWIDRTSAVYTTHSKYPGGYEILLGVKPETFIEQFQDIAPRKWIPRTVEGDAPQDFWRSLPSRAPAPLSDFDLDEAVAWWETYIDTETEVLHGVTVPVARVDPNDVDNHLPGVEMNTEKVLFKRDEAQKLRKCKIAERRSRRNAEIDALERAACPMPDLTLKPTANIYLRPIMPTDVAQITDIYNYYVGETVHANEFNPRSQSQMLSRIDDITGQGLPFIVAIDRSSVFPPRPGQLYVSERVVGFVNLDDYCDPGSMYRFTFELEMYVRPEYLHKGVGKSLLDRLLDLVDPCYKVKGGPAWIVHSDYLAFGSQRVAKTINFTFPHEPSPIKHTPNPGWMLKFMKAFNFKYVGHMKNMGFKNGKLADVTFFQYYTQEEIDPRHRPQVPL